MGLLTKLFGGADGCRETLRESYEKHVLIAIQNGIDSPHMLGLYGALATRYMARGMPVVEIVIWAELAPFMAMKPIESVEALVEYVVFQEGYKDARQVWLRQKINNIFKDYSNKSIASIAYGGILNQVAWCRLLEPSSLAIIEQSITNDE